METITIIDGGLASELEKLGHKLEGDPLWSAKVLATDPESISKVHASYLSAGCRVLTTATYQASVQGYCEYLKLSPEEARQKIAQGVEVAKDAIAKHVGTSGCTDDKYLVAGSIGPYGVFLHDGSEYSGNYVNNMSCDQLIQWHQPRVECLLNAKCDLLAFETIPAEKEAVALCTLLKKYSDAKAWLSFSCKDNEHISHGERLVDAVSACMEVMGPSNDQLLAVGVNCTSPDLVGPLLSSVKAKFPSLPLIAYPNSGEQWESGKGWIPKADLKRPAKYARAWLDMGVRWLGGCCRTTPNDIQAMAKVAQEWEAKCKV